VLRFRLRRPLIGGVLARPADHHWRMFDGRFWRAFPYFLPCATAAAVSLTAFFVGLLWLKEVSGSGTGLDAGMPECLNVTVSYSRLRRLW
jgi:hypothetical protein